MGEEKNVDERAVMTARLQQLEIPGVSDEEIMEIAKMFLNPMAHGNHCFHSMFRLLLQAYLLQAAELNRLGEQIEVVKSIEERCETLEKQVAALRESLNSTNQRNSKYS